MSGRPQGRPDATLAVTSAAKTALRSGYSRLMATGIRKQRATKWLCGLLTASVLGLAVNVVAHQTLDRPSDALRSRHARQHLTQLVSGANEAIQVLDCPSGLGCYVAYGDGPPACVNPYSPRSAGDCSSLREP